MHTIYKFCKDPLWSHVFDPGTSFMNIINKSLTVWGDNHYTHCYTNLSNPELHYLNQWWLSYWRIYASLGLSARPSLITVLVTKSNKISSLVLRFPVMKQISYRRSNDITHNGGRDPARYQSNSRVIDSVYIWPSSAHLMRIWFNRAALKQHPENNYAMSRNDILQDKFQDWF